MNMGIFVKFQKFTHDWKVWSIKSKMSFSSVSKYQFLISGFRQTFDVCFEQNWLKVNQLTYSLKSHGETVDFNSE